MVELKRALGFWTILALSFSSILGTGMFFSVSIGASLSGNGVVIAWIVLSLIAVYVSMFFGELSSMFPKAGGLYEFSKHAYGRFSSFMIGWITWFIGNVSVALLVVAAIDYLLPGDQALSLKLVISVAFILLLNGIAFFGIEASAIILVFFAIITLIILLSIIVPGSLDLQFSELTGFFSGELALGAIALTIFFLAESFFGWESVTFLAEETRNPQRIIPRALVIGTVIVGLLGISVTFISLTIIPADVLQHSAAPLSVVFEQLFGDVGKKLFDIGVFMTLIGAAAGGIVSMPRLLLALSRDKLFITQFASIHPRYQTPYKAIIFQTVVSIIVFFMAFGKYEELLSLSLPLGFILYGLTLLIVYRLRVHHPHLERPFKAPLAKFGSLFLVLLMGILMFFWVFTESGAFDVLKLSLSFILLGLPIYLLLTVYYDPDSIIKINDSLAYFTLLTEQIMLPKHVLNQILKMLGNVRGKTVLEFGCSVGTLTSRLAEQVKPRGMVYATDISRQETLITQRRMRHHGHYHVVVIHDEHQINRVHPKIPTVDAIVSIGMMGYLQDVKKVLREMRELLPHGGKLVFVDYVDFFKFIPNVQWLSDNKQIEQLFREAGFSVFVKRQRGLFWNYVYVYGIKFYEDIVYI